MPNDVKILRLKSDIFDARYLLRSANFTDLDNVAVARDSLGLVAGGSGDIWVEKAGDTMTGPLDVQGSIRGYTNMAVGGGISVVNSNYVFEVLENYTDTSGEKRGLSFVVTAQNTAPSTMDMYGFLGFSEYASSFDTTGTIAGGFGISRLSNTGDVASLYGLFGEVQVTAAGSSSFAVGTVGAFNDSAGGTHGSVYSLWTYAGIATGGTINYYNGLHIGNPFGDGTVTTSHAIHIEDQQKAVTARGLYFAGTGVNNGIEWMSDTNLYRGFANSLASDDGMWFTQDNAILYFGAGFDLAISSDGANGIIDSFNGALELDAFGGNVISNADFQIVKRVIKSKSVYTGTDTTDDVAVHICDSSSAFTLTVTDGTQNGEVIKIVNRGTGTVTLSGNISNITAISQLLEGESIELIWDNTDSEWQ